MTTAVVCLLLGIMAAIFVVVLNPSLTLRIILDVIAAFCLLIVIFVLIRTRFFRKG